MSVTNSVVTDKTHSTQNATSGFGLIRPPAPQPFLGDVPDYFFTDRRSVEARGPTRRGRPFGMLGLGALICREIIRQRRSTIIIPDVVAGQTIWGERTRPKRWRHRLKSILARKQDQAGYELKEENKCESNCPLHDRPEIRHSHFVLLLKPNARFLGALAAYGYVASETGEWTYDFSGRFQDAYSDEHREDRKTAVKDVKKHVGPVYLPLLMFGRSPKSGLTPDQFNIVMAVTREITRQSEWVRLPGEKQPDDEAGKPTGKKRFRRVRRVTRPDAAAVFTAGRQVLGIDMGCPALHEGKRYIAANGNGRGKKRYLRGKGYAFLRSHEIDDVRNRWTGWLVKAGFVSTNDDRNIGWGAKWRLVRRFLMVLKGLQEPFSITAMGHHARSRTWYSLDRMIEMTRNDQGRRRLDKCMLRVYLAETYLSVWRQYFADRLGLEWIPDGTSDGPPRRDDGVVRSSLDLDAWMARKKMTNKALAKLLGLSEQYIRQVRRGYKPWSRSFEARFAAFAEGKTELQRRSPTTTHPDTSRVHTSRVPDSAHLLEASVPNSAHLIADAIPQAELDQEVATTNVQTLRPTVVVCADSLSVAAPTPTKFRSGRTPKASPLPSGKVRIKPKRKEPRHHSARSVPMYHINTNHENPLGDLNANLGDRNEYQASSGDRLTKANLVSAPLPITEQPGDNKCYQASTGDRLTESTSISAQLITEGLAVGDCGALSAPPILSSDMAHGDRGTISAQSVTELAILKRWTVPDARTVSGGAQSGIPRDTAQTYPPPVSPQVSPGGRSSNEALSTRPPFVVPPECQASLARLAQARAECRSSGPAAGVATPFKPWREVPLGRSLRYPIVEGESEGGEQYLRTDEE